MEPAVFREYNKTLRERMTGTVWKSGCESWYLQGGWHEHDALARLHLRVLVADPKLRGG